MNGWLKIYRKLLKSHIWKNSTPEQCKILITLLMMANFENAEVEINGDIFHLEAGQMITSLNSIVEKCGKGISKQNVRTALKRFEKLEFLTQKVTQHFTIITICKYGSYQASEKEPNTPSNTGLTLSKKNKELLTYKKPLSIIFKELMQKASPDLFIDDKTDLPRLKKLAEKIKGLVKEKKKKQGHPYFNCSNEEAVEAFTAFLSKFPAWEKENRFYPEYILNNFGSIINKIRNPDGQDGKPAKKLKLSGLKNLKK